MVRVAMIGRPFAALALIIAVPEVPATDAHSPVGAAHQLGHERELQGGDQNAANVQLDPKRASKITGLI